MESNKQGITIDVLIQLQIVGSVKYPNWVQRVKGTNKQTKKVLPNRKL